MTYSSHFQNYSLMTRTASINSQDLIQVVHNPHFSLISSFNHRFVWCQRSTKKKCHFKPSNSHQSFLPTWNSRTLQKPLFFFLFPDGRLHTRLHTRSAHSVHTSSHPLCTIFTDFLIFADSVLWTTTDRTQFHSFQLYF